MELNTFKSIIETNSIKIDMSKKDMEKLCTLIQPAKQQRVNKKYYATSIVPSTKTPLQMRQIIAALPKTEGEALSNADWVLAVQKLTDFTTRQPVERIIAFYKKRMLTEGLIEEC